MTRLVGLFVSQSRQSAAAMLAGWICFAVLAGAVVQAGLSLTHRTMETAARERLDDVVGLRANAIAALSALAETATAVPCSDRFAEQLREIAYRPDGLNEFLYAPGGVARCSTSVRWFQNPVDLGPPDVVVEGLQGAAVWVDGPLDRLGLRGLSGSIALLGDFAVVIPPPRVEFALPGWMSAETVIRAEDGRSWHRAGTPGLVEALAAHEGGFASDPMDVVCDDTGLDCVIVRADLGGVLAENALLFGSGALAAALIAALTAVATRGALQRYWSFDARFRRNLGSGTVLCAYQPILRLSDDRIVGCEVLARWRDLDGTVVPPDRFLPVVQKSGATLAFTELVAAAAFAELSALPEGGEPLQVNFNIFPGDLRADQLVRVFARFLAAPERFRLVLEIVETDGLDLAAAGAEIEALKAAGCEVYIDDFGTGYFSVENLVALSVSGVKLDRCFAMAPDRSVMSRMLELAVEMVAATGRPVVVEGVETAERLAELRNARHPVHYAQGYYISRPLTADAFAGTVSAVA